MSKCSTLLPPRSFATRDAFLAYLRSRESGRASVVPVAPRVVELPARRERATSGIFARSPASTSLGEWGAG